MTPLTPRNIGIVRDHRKGMTLDEIAAKYGLSRTRVWQIVNNFVLIKYICTTTKYLRTSMRPSLPCSRER